MILPVSSMMHLKNQTSWQEKKACLATIIIKKGSLIVLFACLVKSLNQVWNTEFAALEKKAKTSAEATICVCGKL